MRRQKRQGQKGCELETVLYLCCNICDEVFRGLFNSSAKPALEIGSLEQLINFLKVTQLRSNELHRALFHSWWHSWLSLCPEKLRNGQSHTRSRRGPFMEISRGFPAEQCETCHQVRNLVRMEWGKIGKR